MCQIWHIGQVKVKCVEICWVFELSFLFSTLCWVFCVEFSCVEFSYVEFSVPQRDNDWMFLAKTRIETWHLNECDSSVQILVMLLKSHCFIKTWNLDQKFQAFAIFIGFNSGKFSNSLRNSPCSFSMWIFRISLITTRDGTFSKLLRNSAKVLI